MSSGGGMRRVIFAVLASLCFACSAALAQTAQEHAVLFEENAASQGARFEGHTAWSVKPLPPGPGAAAEPAVEAVVTIPDRQMTVTWTLRRNTDRSLPASHIIEVAFKLPHNSGGDSLDDMPGMLMKAEETAKGTPLAGVAVKVTENYFIFGLSAGNADVNNNVELLENLDWIDIPIVRRNGHHFIVVVQKGASGIRAFDAAFAAWNDASSANAPQNK